MVDSKLKKYEVPKADMNSKNVDRAYTELTFYKQFNLVVCQYHIQTVQFSNTTEHNILSYDKIPIDFRPPQNIFASVVSYAGSVRTGLVGIEPNGRLYIRMGVARTSLNIYGTIVYTVEE